MDYPYYLNHVNSVGDLKFNGTFAIYGIIIDHLIMIITD